MSQTWRTAANVVTLGVVTTVLVAYAFVNWVGAGLIADTYTVTVPMPEAGGILAQQQVTVRGHQVGQVADVAVTAEGVDFELEIDGDASVPVHAVVQILRRSPIGEQALDFIPVAADYEPPPVGELVPTRVPIPTQWEAAGDGARIVPVAALTPSSVPELLEKANDLLTVIDGDSLSTLVHELAVTFDGRVEVLKELNRDSAELGATFVDAIPEFERLIDSSERILTVLRDHRDTLAESFTDAAVVSDTLAANRPTLERILDDGTVALAEADALIRNDRANLSCLNDDLLTLNTRFSRPEHREEIARLLDLNRFFYSGFDAGTQWDPYRPGVLWARVNILMFEQPGGQPFVPRRPTPATRPGAACESPFGVGVNAVRQDDPIPPDPTSPGIRYAPLVAGGDQPREPGADGHVSGVPGGGESRADGPGVLPATGAPATATLGPLVALFAVATALRGRRER